MNSDHENTKGVSISISFSRSPLFITNKYSMDQGHEPITHMKKIESDLEVRIIWNDEYLGSFG
jgi:hypothetical protein